MNDFIDLNTSLISLVDEWEPILLALPPEIINERKNSQNRTIKQIVGHMCDSASNNLHRTIHLQYQDSPLTFPNYATEGNNDRWIAIQNYQNEDWSILVQLWKFSNLHLAHVFENIDTGKLENKWDAGKGKYFSLKEIILDYLPHFELHLREISELVDRA